MGDDAATDPGAHGVLMAVNRLTPAYFYRRYLCNPAFILVEVLLLALSSPAERSSSACLPPALGTIQAQIVGGAVFTVVQAGLPVSGSQRSGGTDTLRRPICWSSLMDLPSSSVSSLFY